MVLVALAGRACGGSRQIVGITRKLRGRWRTEYPQVVAQDLAIAAIADVDGVLEVQVNGRTLKRKSCEKSLGVPASLETACGLRMGIDNAR